MGKTPYDPSATNIVTRRLHIQNLKKEKNNEKKATQQTNSDSAVTRYDPDDDPGAPCQAKARARADQGFFAQN